MTDGPIKIAQQGFDTWAAKPHNAKWVRRIDGTPIPNDLVVCIAEQFAIEARRASPPVAISEERVERAHAAFAEKRYGPNYLNERDAMHAALTAALSAPAPEMVRVKPLEWRLSNVADRWTADHPYGEYLICRDHRASSATSHGWFNEGQWVWFGSLDAAQAAAQSDYEQRIRSALSAPAMGDQPVEPGAMHALHDLRNVLKSVLYHFGPERANKVASDALKLRNSPDGPLKQLLIDGVLATPRPAVEAGWRTMPRGGVEHDWWAESVKQYRRFRKLRKAAQAVVDEMGKIHDNDPYPLKYRAPFGAIAALANLLATFPDYALPSVPTPEKEGEQP